MQTPPRIKMHKSKSYHLKVWGSLAPHHCATVLLALLALIVHPGEAWQYTDNQQVFPNRHPDFYHPPANVASNQFMNSQNLYNQPLNSPLQQQFLTPTSTNVAQQSPSSGALQAQLADQPTGTEPFSALFAPNGRIAPSSSEQSLVQQQQQQQQPQPVTTNDVLKSVHEQPINARDTSQQQQQQPQQQANPLDSSISQIKSNDYQSNSKQDHDIVASPSPLGKILDVVARETIGALSNSISASSKDTTTKDAKQVSSSAVATAAAVASEGKVTHATKSESDSKQASTEQVVLHLKPLTSATTQKKKKNDKSSVNSIEQQIINQHARATSYATLHSRRYEPPTQSATPAPAQQQLVRLLPTKHRGDTKLFSNLLSTLAGGGGGGGGVSGGGSHNSASAASNGAADSSSQSAANGLSSLMDNFKSGISSRSSIVKAAISDNKLARTLTNVGKTIGGNKYVASAGAAAALAALGLTVSKFLGPYVMAGSYSKLGAAGPMEPLVTSGSFLQPSYMTGGFAAPGPDRNFHYLPVSLEGGYGFRDSMLAAAASNQQQTGSYLEPPQIDQNTMSQFQSAFNSYASQQQAGSSELATPPPGGNIYASYRPSLATTGGGSTSGTAHRPTGGSSSQKNAFDAGANGHYSGFYSSQPEYEQQNGSGGLDLSAVAGQPPQPQQQHQQQFGSYISGTPTGGEYSTAPGGSSDLVGYPSLGTDSLAGSTSGYPQVDFSSANGVSASYEPGSISNQQYDQIMSAASSDTPTYANNLLQNGRASFPSSKTSLANGGRGAPQDRSGAVMLKLDEATRNLIRQQLQAETARASSLNLAPTSYNYLTLNSWRPQQPQQVVASRGVDQSSGEMASSLESHGPTAPMTDQRAGAADSSGDYATFVQWQSPSSSGAQQGGGGGGSGGGSGKSGVTIESNYGAQSTTHPRQEQQQQQQQDQFVAMFGGQQRATSGDGAGRVNISPTLAYNSIRPQMQTRRNEPTSGSAYVLIRPNTMHNSQVPVDSSQSSSNTGQPHVRAQPQLVPIVGSSRSSLSPSSSSSSATAGWSSVASKRASQTTSGSDKKLPAATVGSLNSPTSGSSVELGEQIYHEKNSKTSSVLNRATRDSQAGRMPSTPAVQVAEELANNSWLVPAVDQQSLIRDYEVLAARQQQQQQPVDGVAAMSQVNKPHEEKAASSQQDDELLQVASSMRANLIQLANGRTATGSRPRLSVVAAAAGGGGGGNGAEYQLDMADGVVGEMEANNSFDDKKKERGVGGNKLIEAKTNTNNAAAAVAIVVAADGGKQPSLQHHNRHRSHSLSKSTEQLRGDRAATTTTTITTEDSPGEGDNVLVLEPPLPSSQAAQQQHGQVAPPATTKTTATNVDQQTLSAGLSQATGDTEQH